MSLLSVPLKNAEKETIRTYKDMMDSPEMIIIVLIITVETAALLLVGEGTALISTSNAFSFL